MKYLPLLLSAAVLCASSSNAQEELPLTPQPQLAVESITTLETPANTLSVDAQSQDSKNFRIGAHVSSLGFGPDLTYQFNPYLKMGISGNYFTLERKRTVKINGRVNGQRVKLPVPTTGNLRMFSTGLLMDVHPFGGSFYVRGGAFYNGNQVNVKAQPKNETIYLNDIPYQFDANGYGAGKVHFNRIAPYLGLGFDWALESAAITLDAGVLFQGKAKAKVTALEGITAGGLHYMPTAHDIFNFEREVEKQVNKHKVLQFYPVISLGVHFKF
jgi:hypothetical protein